LYIAQSINKKEAKLQVTLRRRMLTTPWHKDVDSDGKEDDNEGLENNLRK
jgi:hypothetical protein